MPSVQGKGFFIWKIPSCEGGNPGSIASVAQTSGLTFVPIKIADGTRTYNYDSARALDLVPGVRDALRAKGIQVWGWHYVYGADPLGEARRAIQRLNELNLDGYIIDAEGEYKEPGRATAAQQFMNQMRAAYPSLPMALASYRYPDYHQALPWSVFLERVDYNMPQVYWEQAHNPADQLVMSVNQFKKYAPFRPILPVGPAYKVSGWAPSESDILAFMKKAEELGLSAASFFSWDECKRDLPNIWKTVANYYWTGGIGNDLVNKLVAAMNAHDPTQVMNLYSPTAVRITSSRTLQGSENIRSWYSTFFNTILPNATFTVTSISGTANSRRFTWQATSNRGRILNGNDTVGLIQDKINYHYSYFTVTTA
jgi:hypothetical protein